MEIGPTSLELQKYTVRYDAAADLGSMKVIHRGKVGGGLGGGMLIRLGLSDFDEGD